jgi:hypothetical protein
MQVIEFYIDFQPPFDIKGDTEDLLRHVPERYLVGLGSIVITNSGALNRNERNRKLLSRKRKVSMSRVRGTYTAATRSESAYITLYADKITDGHTGWFIKIPLVRHLILSEVLYHEIGHHIDDQHRPEYREKEDIADDWERKLGVTFFRRRYWYLIPFVRTIRLLPQVKSWLDRNSQRKRR